MVRHRASRVILACGIGLAAIGSADAQYSGPYAYDDYADPYGGPGYGGPGYAGPGYGGPGYYRYGYGAPPYSPYYRPYQPDVRQRATNPDGYGYGRGPTPSPYVDPYDGGGEPQSGGGYDLGPNGNRTTREEVSNPTRQPPGTIVIDTSTRHLYYTEANGQALRYGIGVGREGFAWKGVAKVERKAEWPAWIPPSDMLKRRPDLPTRMEGGIDNPLGARALYLFQGSRDTLFRIHGTNEPDTIGKAVSSGCIRMMNADVIDLYRRVPVGTKVVVL